MYTHVSAGALEGQGRMLGFGLVRLFSYTPRTICRVVTSHGGLGPFTSIFSQENGSQIYPQASLVGSFSQLRSPLQGDIKPDSTLGVRTSWLP